MRDPVTVEVREGECPCPGSPHTVESVVLMGELTLPVASAALAEMRTADPTIGAQQAALTRAYLPGAIIRWTFVEIDPEDPKGVRVRPVPLTAEAVERLLPWDQGGMEVAEQADDLYSERLMRPLVRRMARRSGTGPMESSTSQSLPSGSAAPEPSERSSQPSGDGRPSEVPAP